MNGKFPKRSLYKTPECLSANAPKQKMFATISSQPSAMIAGTACPGIQPGPGSPIILGGGTCAILGWLAKGGPCFCRVLLIPWRVCFMWPFAVAGLGLRYLRISFSDRFGQPFRKRLHTAFNNVEIFGLHNDWCANLPHLRMFTQSV